MTTVQPPPSPSSTSSPSFCTALSPSSPRSFSFNLADSDGLDGTLVSKSKPEAILLVRGFDGRATKSFSRESAKVVMENCSAFASYFNHRLSYLEVSRHIKNAT